MIQTGRIRFFLRRLVVETILDTVVTVVSDFVERDTIDDALLGVFEKKKSNDDKGRSLDIPALNLILDEHHVKFRFKL